MKRIFSLGAVLFFLRLPQVVLSLKNWGAFLLRYAGARKDGTTYRFRSGLSIETGDAMSASTLAVVFFKKDYGHVPPGSLVIDVGANIGTFALYAAQSLGARIYAFEPAPDNFGLLSRNIQYNAMEKKIFPFRQAVAGKAGRRILYLRKTRSPFHSFVSARQARFQEDAGEEQELEVPCTTLQEIFEANHITWCDLLKMDCEGAEFEIVYALPLEYFARLRRIRMEYHNQEKPKNAESLVSFLEKQGFSVKRWRQSSPWQGDLWFERAS